MGTPYITRFVLNSRIHPLRAPFSKGVFIKRDDELSSGISGSKYRKYSSLIPFLQRQKFTDVILMGGFRSNHVIGSAQILRECGFKPHVFFENGFVEKTQAGNHLLSRLLFHSDEVTLYDRRERDQVEILIQNKKQQLELNGGKVFVLPEGADCEQSFEGAKTLAHDVERNEKEENVFFKRIFLDVGTGLVAEAFLSQIHSLSERTIHLVICAGDFKKSRERFAKFTQVKFYDDTKRFGDPTLEQLTFVQQFARTQGVLIDPIYGSKLFSVALQNTIASESTLIVHSGGVQSIHGFADRYPADHAW